ncbi:hypothetical protein AZF37_00940 [endosymbiont 'TC1' of Trimyema compressum]|uniref:DUF4179 domain-containing protein n=1 Tax=endosymbiont 'TC1' of Trimyema compressum TaxID=243899 RepID=UPI0007F08F39|nr:DUF4179 domain-containing protein [endosymbiont 'TC1' of Trimyema compressum]AMP19935.1 hypothetical protein AZF37_00940 [endosymbiont 'TC1' of Trimyema compressum]
MLQQEIDSIEVPKEVTIAIKKGCKKNRKKKTLFKIMVSGISAIVLTVLMVAAMPSILSYFPTIDKMEDTIGSKLKAEGKITPQNITAEDKGITIIVTGSYFNGGQIGVLYSVKGLPKDCSSPEIASEIKMNDENLQFANETGRGTNKLFKKDQDTYEGGFTMSYPGEVAGENFTLPLEINNIFEVINPEKKGASLNINGSWNFNIPIGTMKVEITNVNSVKSLPNMDIGISKIIKGEYCTSIDYYVASNKEILDADLYSKNASTGEEIGGVFISSGAVVKKKKILGVIKQHLEILLKINLILLRVNYPAL